MSQHTVRLEDDGDLALVGCIRGKRTTLSTGTYSTGSSPYSVRIKVDSADEATACP